MVAPDERIAPAQTGALRLRLSLFYAGFFGFVGVQLPFWPVWLASHGLGATEIGVILALSIGAKTFSAPLMAHGADRSGQRRRPIVFLVTGSLATFGLFALTHGFWPILLISVLFNALWPPVMSLTESLTIMAVQRTGLDYGRMRLWGSLSFIVVALLSGQVLVWLPPSAVLWLSLACVAATAAACFFLPDIRTERSPAHHGLPLVQALRNRAFSLSLVACGLIQGSHAVYYAFGTLHWQAKGYSENVIGVLWAEGVLAEIVLFAHGGRITRALGSVGLITLAGIAAVVRWLGTGLTDSLAAVVVLQALHAFSFAAAHLGAMACIGETVPASLSATAQSLYSGLVWGAGLGLMLFASGWLYEDLGGSAYLVMVAVALAGTFVALRLSALVRPVP
ncbi:MAG: MFS transporter [Defluviicoccus sp.]